MNKKITAALAGGLVPIVCVGEVLAEREAGETEKVVAGQVRGCLKGFKPSEVEDIIVAYEPVWAIGTGRVASTGDAQQVNRLIRYLLVEMFGLDAASKVRILYGGSVKPDNAADLMAQPDIDGGLIGGASRKPQDFARIIAATAAE